MTCARARCGRAGRRAGRARSGCAGEITAWLVTGAPDVGAGCGQHEDPRRGAGLGGGPVAARKERARSASSRGHRTQEGRRRRRGTPPARPPTGSARRRGTTAVSAVGKQAGHGLRPRLDAGQRRRARRRAPGPGRRPRRSAASRAGDVDRLGAGAEAEHGPLAASACRRWRRAPACARPSGRRRTAGRRARAPAAAPARRPPARPAPRRPRRTRARRRRSSRMAGDVAAGAALQPVGRRHQQQRPQPLGVGGGVRLRHDAARGVAEQVDRSSPRCSRSASTSWASRSKRSVDGSAGTSLCPVARGSSRTRVRSSASPPRSSRYRWRGPVRRAGRAAAGRCRPRCTPGGCRRSREGRSRQVHRADRSGADASAMPASTSAGTALSTVSAMSASPPCSVRLTCAPAMFTPASPSVAPTTPTTPGRSSYRRNSRWPCGDQLDVEAVDLDELLDLPRAGQRAAHGDARRSAARRAR